MSEESYYELLQVSENADQEIIQAAYRRVMLRHHPDRSNEPNAAEMTQRLNDAYSILSDPARKAQYDRERRGRTSSSSSGTGQTSSRTSQNRPPPPPKPPKQPTEWSRRRQEAHRAQWDRCKLPNTRRLAAELPSHPGNSIYCIGYIRRCRTGIRELTLCAT